MKIFIITSRFPYPIDKGDKLRIYHQIKHLSKKNEIFLYSLNDEEVEDNSIRNLKKFCSEVKVYRLGKIRIVGNLMRALFSNIPFQVSYFYSAKIKKDIHEEIRSFRPDVIYCQLIRMAEYVRELSDQPKVIDYVDVISKGLERRIATSGIFFRTLIKIEYKRVVEYEGKILDSFNESIIITEQDRSQLPLEDPDRVKVIPNGVDLDFFRPVETNKEYDIAFIGNLSYPPNVKASKFLAKEIIPLIKKKYGKICTLIAGSSPVPGLKALDSEEIKIKGWTEDIREYYSKARIFIAPIHLGTGLQNKLLEAMAMKIPCITSLQCQKGIMAPVDTTLMVASTAQEYADAVIHLLSDPGLSETIAENAYKFVHANYSWERITDRIEEILGDYEQKN